jgi:hypothetical protein
MGDKTFSLESDCFSIDSSPYGLSYGQWTVKWWIWFLSTPKSINPVLDMSGRYASVNQPPSNVWFLSGKLADEDKNIPSRVCNIPVDRSILFPVINCEANPLEYPQLKTKQQLMDHVTADENTILEKVCVLDGKPVPVKRVNSDPPIFEVPMNEDNVCGVKGRGRTIAYGDGYWVFLKPLSPGDHLLSFRGSCENGRLRSGANYRLMVQDNDFLDTK